MKNLQELASRLREGIEKEFAEHVKLVDRDGIEACPELAKALRDVFTVGFVCGMNRVSEGRIMGEFR